MAINAAGNWSLEAVREIAAHPETAVFMVFDKYAMGKVLSILTIIVLILFFITSADSATLSLSIFSSDGAPNPPIWKKIVWGIVEAATAFVLLLSGGLKPLQTISIVFALPFLIILVLIAVSLIKNLSSRENGNAASSLPICIGQSRGMGLFK